LKKVKTIIVSIAIVVLVAVTAYGIGSGSFFAPDKVQADAVLFNEDMVTTIYENASPAVVAIEVTKQSSGGFLGRFPSSGEGSGFILDNQNGYVLTNNHVIEGANNINITLSTGSSMQAEVMGTDNVHDLALLKVDGDITNIKKLTLADSNLVKPGQMAVAIGNPYGYANSITVGIISGLNRTISTSNYTGMLQTDAAINPGNSGGPLLNANGEVIGINTAVESPVTGAQGIGFAVPSNVAKSVLPSLEKGEKIVRPWIGITGMTITGSVAESLGLDVQSGVYVTSVASDSPADEAGIKGSRLNDQGEPDSGGDIITAIDDKAVNSIQVLVGYVSEKQVGDEVTLTILRDGETFSLGVTLAARPDESKPVQVPSFPGRGGRNFNFGFDFPDDLE